MKTLTQKYFVDLKNSFFCIIIIFIVYSCNTFKNYTCDDYLIEFIDSSFYLFPDYYFIRLKNNYNQELYLLSKKDNIETSNSDRINIYDLQKIKQIVNLCLKEIHKVDKFNLKPERGPVVFEIDSVVIYDGSYLRNIYESKEIKGLFYYK